MDLTQVVEFISASGGYVQDNWIQLIIMYIIANVISISAIVNSLLNLVKKLPVQVREPILVFLNRFGKELDKQIPDDSIKGK